MRLVDLPGKRAALVVAHPGHELRLHGWLTIARPVVHVLTDGSGATGPSRLASTRRVVAAAKATEGEVFGAMTDAAVYAAILSRDVAALGGIVASLARSFEAHEIDHVVVDAVEGYNPAHDLVSILVAAAIAEGGRDRRPAVFDYAVVAPAIGDAPRAAVRVVLDGADLERKREAGTAY